jgi:hypothetical protein
MEVRSILNVRLIGCFQNRLRRITTATIKAQMRFCLPTPMRAEKSKPPALPAVVDAKILKKNQYFFWSILSINFKSWRNLHRLVAGLGQIYACIGPPN